MRCTARAALRSRAVALAGPGLSTKFDDMTRNPTARRVHRQDSAPDDVFVARILETSAWAKQNRRLLVIGGIITAAVVIGLLYFITTRQTQRALAATQLTQVRAVALSGNSQLAIRELEQFLARFGGTPSADEARLMLGRAYLEVGQAQQARDVVAQLAANLGSGIGINAAMLVASAHEASQEPHLAEEIYLRLADDAEFLFQRQDALDNAARIRLQRGDAAGAAEMYQRLLDITPLSNTERPIFELRLGEAQALAALGGGTTNAAVPPTAPVQGPAQIDPAAVPPTTTGN
jgi:predicted negative regulator of RcsB-dependent stress response